MCGQPFSLAGTGEMEYRAEGNPARSVYQEDQRMVFQPNKQ